ncbi:50S ribosomal protein L29 [Alphaproteobacteria bacterium]|nr:50S ribosomal protein L29 [Alphaproteobacteria bacterium]
MAKYKSKDLLTKTKDELNDRIQFLRKEQFNLRFQLANGQIENPLRFRLIRREIAAIKTIINNNLMKVK